MSFCCIRKVAKVRKARQCILCGEGIEVGQPAERRVGSEGGDFWSNYVHPECAAHEATIPWVKREDWYEMYDGDPMFKRQAKEGTP
jgi:hypothetical protein